MNALPESTMQRIEQYVDGELAAADMRDIEAILSNDPSAQAYLRALEEVRSIPRTAIATMDSMVDFSRLEASIMGAIEADASDQSPERQHELELLTMAWVDGELHEREDVQRVFDYLAVTPAARDAVEAQREIQRTTRAYAHQQSQSVDFARLLDRTMSSIEGDAQDHATQKAGGEVIQLNSFLQRFKAPLAAAVGIAAAMAIMLPMVLQSGNAPTNITNNFYGINVDNMDVDPGYSGTIVRGTPKGAPVVWISNEPDSVPRALEEPSSKDEDSSKEKDENSDVLDI